jgi:SAM-dependent methyltransferase
MDSIFRDDDFTRLLLPGIPADYLHTPVFGEENQALLADRDVMFEVLADTVPLPTTAAREGYFSDRHLEYWLSGRRDAGKVIAATPLTHSAPRILDFGGASGRVIRHFRKRWPEAELYLSDTNPVHVALARQLFGGDIRALHNRANPSLPFPDGYLDCVMAFSVFTHIDHDDTAWLMEVRRVLKPSGHLYITVHDQATWEILPQTVIGGMSMANDDFRAYHTRYPTLTGRKVHIYNPKSDSYHCNVFVGLDYIERHWAPLFSGYSLAPLAHDHQSGLVFHV